MPVQVRVQDFVGNAIRFPAIEEARQNQQDHSLSKLAAPLV
jgi:hypothetical protein